MQQKQRSSDTIGIASQRCQNTWMKVHHEAEDERYHRYIRYMVSERHEVSAVELWDEQQDQMMRENEGLLEENLWMRMSCEKCAVATG